nr:putative reverse transcriptase domain-containing protein [Tanacetum cinerariifolium]
MLRACVIDFGGNWDVHLPLAEFSYNNSYQSSIRRASFEDLYGRKCRSLALWAEIRESRLIGQELVQDMTDKAVLIKEKLKAVLLWKGVICFGKKGKLASRYVRQFEILERISPIAYRLRLPEELSSVHDTFHVSNLKKCLANASLHVPLEEIRVDETICFTEEPAEIMDYINMTNKAVLIKEKLKAVLPWKGVICFGKKGKLASRYVRQFEILERIGPVAYRLRLPEELSSVHDTFHVSNLKKCLANASLHVPLEEIRVDETICFAEEPVEIMDGNVPTHADGKVFTHYCVISCSDLDRGTRSILIVVVLYTPLCCDDTHDVTPRVSALAGCDTGCRGVTLGAGVGVPVGWRR